LPGDEKDPRQHFIENRVVRLLLKTSKLDLNDLAEMYHMGMFSQQEYAEFYTMLGYTLDGFMELSIFSDMDIDNPEEG